MHLVFVYGSLKAGFGNHRLLSSSEFVSTGELDNAELYSLGGFPAVIVGNDSVSGEIYEVDEATLKALDALEGHPRFYKRETHLISCHSMNGTLPCHVYFYQHEVQGDMYIPCGEWLHEHIHAQADALRRQSKEAV